jgi:hypothetical protein
MVLGAFRSKHVLTRQECDEKESHPHNLFPTMGKTQDSRGHLSLSLSLIHPA